MLALPTISADVTAEQALKLLEQAGWRHIGIGDWSWVLADTSDTWVARITPFDPAYRMHAVGCLTGPPNRWLPHIAISDKSIHSFCTEHDTGKGFEGIDRVAEG